MSSDRRPPRRRTSALTAEHPAWPTPAARPDAPAAPVPVEPQDPHAEHITGTAQPPTVPPTPAPTPVPERVSAHARAPRRSAESSPVEAQARKFARDAAYGWAATVRRTHRRVQEWVAAIDRARGLGSSPDALIEFIHEAAERAGVRPEDVPPEVWSAVGRTPGE